MKQSNEFRMPAMIMGMFVALMPQAALAEGGFGGVDREITLKERGEVWSQTVCLADVVQEGWVQSRCSVDRHNCCRWNLNGERSRSFSRKEIEKEVKKIIFPGVNLIVKGETVVVTQTKRDLTTQEISDKIEAALMNRLGSETDNVVVESVKIISPASIAFNDESDWDVAIADPVRDSLSIKIISMKHPLKILGWGEATIRIEASVYVAKKTIRPMDTLQLADFALKKAPILGGQAGSVLQNGIFREGMFPIGVRARQTIFAGSPLVTASIERVPMVRLGDSVTLLLRSDSLRVSTKGVVQGSAALGDMVTVQLPRYNRAFRGRLLEGRLVEVWL